MVLPALSGLPGGYVGTVTAISADGSTITLIPATLSDAFDYYKIDVPNIEASTAAARLSSALGNELPVWRRTWVRRRDQ